MKTSGINSITPEEWDALIRESSAEQARVKAAAPDPVNSPDHYNTGDIECIDAIRSALGSEGFVNYCHGNALKYLWRWPHKNGTEDVEKALVYLDWMIKEGR